MANYCTHAFVVKNAKFGSGILVLIFFFFFLNFIVEDSKKEENGEVEDDDDFDCCVCFGKGHVCMFCPYLCKIPPGATLGDDYDRVCLGCGKIGRKACCCPKGQYAVLMRCGFCFNSGHWHWDCPHRSSESPKC